MLSILATFSLTTLLGALLILVVYCKYTNMIEHDCKTYLLCIFAGFLSWFFIHVAIVMTDRLQPPPVMGLPLYVEKWTKYSSIQSSVFPFALDTLLELLTLYPNCGPVHKLRTSMNNCCHLLG